MHEHAKFHRHVVVRGSSDIPAPDDVTAVDVRNVGSSLPNSSPASRSAGTMMTIIDGGLSR